MLKAFLAVLFTALLLMPVAANAENTLVEKEVESFIGSLEEVNALSEQMKADGRHDIVTQRVQNEPPLVNGNFSPYTKSLLILKEEFPENYKKLGGIVKDHGFSSQEDWAETGDEIMRVYMVTQVSEETLEGMKATNRKFAPEMMDQIPDEYRAQVESSLAMMDAITKVSKADIAILEPYLPALQKHMSDQSASTQ